MQNDSSASARVGLSESEMWPRMAARNHEPCCGFTFRERTPICDSAFAQVPRRSHPKSDRALYENGYV